MRSRRSATASVDSLHISDHGGGVKAREHDSPSCSDDSLYPATGFKIACRAKDKSFSRAGQVTLDSTDRSVHTRCGVRTCLKNGLSNSGGR